MTPRPKKPMPTHAGLFQLGLHRHSNNLLSAASLQRDRAARVTALHGV
jgi:hypothetical protein